LRVQPGDWITFFGLVALAQLWNLLGGFAGLISVGQQAYVGIGAYGVWLLGDVLHINPFLSAVLAGLLAVCIALPAAPLLFRLRGGYFAIGTWVVAEVMKLVVSNIPQTKGGSGLTLASVYNLSPTVGNYGTFYLGLALAVASILVVFFLLRSRLGLALTAIRDNDLAAQSSGVNVFRAKLWVYLIAAFGGGVIGGVTALNLTFIQPKATFDVINWTAAAIFIVVIGGFGSIEGPIVGAIIYFALQQTLSQHGPIYLLILGGLAVLMATLAPRGVWGWIDRLWHVHLFPVRRRLIVDARPARAAEPPASTGDAGVHTEPA
jgi:branched-chain amino acid transport system permease protein